MATTNNYESTLPYFLTHGTRSNEFCFIMGHGKLRCIVYIDRDDRFIDTIPQELWDSKVVRHYYEALTLCQSFGSGEVKSISNIQVHYVEIER